MIKSEMRCASGKQSDTLRGEQIKLVMSSTQTELKKHRCLNIRDQNMSIIPCCLVIIVIRHHICQKCLTPYRCIFIKHTDATDFFLNKTSPCRMRGCVLSLVCVKYST